MFYAHFVLAKKGPLAKVWLAAHWDKKLTKSHVFETDVEKTVDDIISPQMKMALRTSGHLLLGVVRIYSMKQKYLIQDLGEACAKIKMAFRPGAVDLPIDSTKRANTDAITLPEIFNDFEAAVVDIGSLDMDAFLRHNQGALEDITLPPQVTEKQTMVPLDDDFGEADDMLEDIQLPMAHPALEESTMADNNNTMEKSDVDDGRRPQEVNNDDAVVMEQSTMQEDLSNLANLAPVPTGGYMEEQADGLLEAMDVGPLPMADQPTVNEENGFVLEPLDTTASVKVRQKRKRRLIIDAKKELTSDAIRRQLKDPSDTLKPKCFPPPSKKYLRWRETSTVEQLLSRPAMTGLSREAAAILTSNYTSNIDDGTTDVPMEGEEEEVREDEIPLNINLDPIPDVSVPLDAPTDVPVPTDVLVPTDVPVPTDGLVPTDVPVPADVPVPTDVLVPDEVNAMLPDDPSLIQQQTLEETVPEDEGEATQGGKKWNKCTERVVTMLDKGFTGSDTISFTELSSKCKRKEAASRFYSLLLLAKEGVVKFKQDKPYGEISIKKGVYYDS